jgi:hypothetical protein
MLITMVTRRKVPTWGWASVRMSSGAPALHELGQHLAAQVARVLDPGIELAVRECPRAAFSELGVGFGFQHRAAPQAPGVLGPVTHRLAALDDDGLQTHLRQDQRRQKPAGTGADHDRARTAPALGRHDRELVAEVRGRLHMRIAVMPLQHGILIPHHGIDRVDQLDRGFLARIVAAPEHGEADQVFLRDAQLGQHRRFQRGRFMVQRQGQVGQADHPAAFRRDGAQRQAFTPPLTLSVRAARPVAAGRGARQTRR